MFLYFLHFSAQRGEKFWLKNMLWHLIRVLSKFKSYYFQQKGEIVAKAQNEFTQFYPKNGWVEHDPNEILFSEMEAILSVLRQGKVAPEDIAGIGITNQRETTIVWDKETGVSFIMRLFAVPPNSGLL